MDPALTADRTSSRIATACPAQRYSMHGVPLTLTPEQGYGERDEKAIRNVPRRKLPSGKVAVGTQFRMQTEDGVAIGTVKALRGDYATVDLNHPLAGRTLHFDVKVVEVRDATEEELSHGHVHSPGDHHH